MRLIAFALFSLALALSSSAATNVALTVASDGVSVQGATPGGKVILFGVEREPRFDHSNVHRTTEVLTDTDGDGTVRYAAPISEKSIWVAVDLATGAAAAQTGPDYPRREVAAADVFKRDNVGQMSKFENARGWAELLVVRPDAGAWRTGAGKDSLRDENRGKPAALRLDVSAFMPVDGASAGALQHLRRGDVVAMIDPVRMEFYVTTVGED